MEAEVQAEAERARLEAERQAKDDLMERTGLPIEYPSEKTSRSVWYTKATEDIGELCSAADEVHFRTSCGRSLSEFLHDTCRFRPAELSSDQSFPAAAKAVLEAYHVFM